MPGMVRNDTVPTLTVQPSATPSTTALSSTSTTLSPTISTTPATVTATSAGASEVGSPGERGPSRADGRARRAGRVRRGGVVGVLGGLWTVVSTVHLVAGAITAVAALTGIGLYVAQTESDRADRSHHECGATSCTVHLVEGEEHEVGWTVGDPFGQEPRVGGTTVLRLERLGEMSTVVVDGTTVLCREGALGTVGSTGIDCGGRDTNSLDLTLRPL